MRLDIYLVANNFYKSRNKASEGIEKGEVLINGTVCLKVSEQVNEGDLITLNQAQKPFVSVGGDKLERAIKALLPAIEGKVFIDVGASTGGFTDCLLRRGARKVYCVDVGENLLDECISSDSRVVVMDRTNARYLKQSDFSELADGIVVDCSFISLEYILPPLKNLLSIDGYILALVKPQFELQEKTKLKNGILKNTKERDRILQRLYDFSINQGFVPISLVCVTIDKKKNSEFIFMLKKQGQATPFEKLI